MSGTSNVGDYLSLFFLANRGIMDIDVPAESSSLILSWFDLLSLLIFCDSRNLRAFSLFLSDLANKIGSSFSVFEWDLCNCL